MKKSLVAALTGALVIGATATTFAAPSDSPFSDVPEGHWAYNAVVTLTRDGVIEGYGDGTFRGNRNITRYEMAQMVARALARYSNTSGADQGAGMTNAERQRLQDLEAGQEELRQEIANGKSGLTSEQASLLQKLKVEFAPELKRLGVRVNELEDRVDDLDGRVSDLERNADVVKWTGKIEYTYNHRKFTGYGATAKTSGHDGVFRLEPSAELNDHWKAVARFDANFSLQNDSTQDVFLKRAYAQGDYDKFGIKLGRIGFCPSIEDGVAVDTVVSGAELSFGSKWKFIATAGRAGGGDEPEYAGFYSRSAGTSDDPTDIVGLNVRYNPGDTGLYGGASYYFAKDGDFADYSNKTNSWGIPNEDKAGIWAVGLGYKFNSMFDLHGSYANNSKADYQDNAWAVDLRYGKYGDYADQGDWAIWAGYARFGRGVGIVSNQGDDIRTGEKGWHVGAGYAPFKNVGLQVRYADAKVIDSKLKDKHFWARAEFFF